MGTGTLIRLAAGASLLSFVGCGGGDSGPNYSVSGGEDPARVIAEQNAKAPVDKSDPNFTKMATPEKKNTARDPGVSSGGGSSSAILD